MRQNDSQIAVSVEHPSKNQMRGSYGRLHGIANEVDEVLTGQPT